MEIGTQIQRLQELGLGILEVEVYICISDEEREDQSFEGDHSFGLVFARRQIQSVDSKRQPCFSLDHQVQCLTVVPEIQRDGHEAGL